MAKLCRTQHVERCSCPAFTLSPVSLSAAGALSSVFVPLLSKSPLHHFPAAQMDEEGAPTAVVVALRAATEVGDWPLAGEAVWAMELMAGMSRRLTSGFG